MSSKDHFYPAGIAPTDLIAVYDLKWYGLTLMGRIDVMEYLPKNASLIERNRILTSYGQDKMHEGFKDELYEIIEGVQRKAGNKAWLINFSDLEVSMAR